MLYGQVDYFLVAETRVETDSKVFEGEQFFIDLGVNKFITDSVVGQQFKWQG